MIVNGDVEETDSSVEKDVENSFRVDLDSDENYDWRIECTDEYGNKGVSATWDFDIDEIRDTSSSGSSHTKNLLIDDSSNVEQPKKTNFETLNFDDNTIELGNEKPIQMKSTTSSIKIENWIIPILIVGILFLLIMIVVFRRR